MSAMTEQDRGRWAPSGAGRPQLTLREGKHGGANCVKQRTAMLASGLPDHGQPADEEIR